MSTFDDLFDESPRTNDALKVDDLFDDTADQQTARNNIRFGIEVNPDKAAQSQQLAKRYGLPAGVVEQFHDDYSVRAKADDAAAVIDQAPALRGWLAADQNRAKIVHDDIDNLSGTEKALSYLWGSAKAGGNDFLAASAKLLDVSHVEDRYNPFEKGSALWNRYNENKANEVSFHNLLMDAAKNRTVAANTNMESLPQSVKDTYGNLRYATTDTNQAAYLSPVKVVSDAIRSLPTTAALALTVYLTKGASVTAETGALAAGATEEAAKTAGIKAAEAMAMRFGAASEGAVGYAQQALQTQNQIESTSFDDLAKSPEYQKLIADGYDPSTARIYLASRAGEQAGVGAGAVDALTNLLGGKFLGEAIGEGGSLLKRTAKGFATEAITEGIQSPGEQVAQNIAVKVNADPQQALLDGVLESAIQGFAVGGLTGGAFSGVLGRHKREEIKATQADQSAATIESINKLAQASKVAARDVDTFEDFVAKATEDGPVQDIYIDAQTLAQSGIADQVAEVSPAVQSQYAEALAIGGSIRIPMSEYTARIATKPELSGPLLEHLKTDPMGFSASEAKTYQKEQGPSLEAEIGRALEQAQGNDAFNASRDAVKQSMLDQLNAVGRNTPAVNEAYASLFAARTAVRAQQLGITPEEMAQKQLLRVQGEAVAGQGLSQAKQDNSLIIQHSTTAEKIDHALRIGGFAIPSLAITKADQGINGFGDITLIGRKEMADPKGYAKTQVYGADVYSPRYPEVQFKLDSGALKRLNNRLKSYNDGREIYSGEIEKVDDLTQNDAFRKYVEADGTESSSYHDRRSIAVQLLQDVGADERIFTGYTNSGNRRYTPHTLDNVIKILKKEIRGGENFNYGVGSLRAHFTPQFKSVKQIKENADRLMSSDGFKAVKDEIDKEFWSLVEQLQPSHPASKGFGFGDTVISTLTDAAKMGIPRALKENGFDEVDSDIQKELAAYLNKLRQLPTEYFEAKILRDVSLSEFAGAVVPAGTPKRVYDLLEKNGLEVSTYLKGDEADRRKVIKALAEIKSQLFQGAGDRGGFSPSQNIITLLKNADLSTFEHELAHYFFENDIALSNELIAKPERTAGEQQIVDDVSALLKWHGLEGDVNEQLDQWNQMDFEQRRVHHERTAESFESYLFSGRAPSIELSHYFQKFREFMLQVYKSLKQFLAGHPEAGKLNDEVRGVFDRMLATDEQIALAEQARSMLPLFKTAEEASKFGVDFETYQALAKGSTQAAIETLQAQGLKDMQWLHNAHGREVSKLKKQSEALRREIRTEVRTEVMQRPVYQAWSFLTRRMTEDDKLVKAKKKEGIDPTQDSLFTAIAKLGGLNKEEVVSTWGVDPKANAMSEFGKHVLKNDGRSIDGMLEVLVENGYLTQDENGKGDTRELEEKFDNELRGKPEYSFQKDYNEPSQVANPGALTAGRLDAALVQNMDLPPEMVKRLEDFKMTRKTGGLHPDLVADMFGLSSGDDLVRALYDVDPPQTAIEKATDARMLAEHGELATEEAIAKAADKALYNAARGKMLVADANALAKASEVKQDAGTDKRGRKRTINILPAAAKEAAANLISRVVIRNLRPAQYEAAEIKAGKATEKAKNAGKLEEAAAQARTRLFNHYAAMEAYTAQDEVADGVKYLKKVQTPGKIPADHFDQITSILDKFDLRQATNKKLDNAAMFQTWARAQLEAGNVPPNIELLLTPAQRAQFTREVSATTADGQLIYGDEEKQAELLAGLLDQAPVRNYRQLTIEEFRGLVDTIKQIEHIGRRTKRVLTDRKKREFNAVVDEIKANIVAVATEKGRKSTDVRTPTDSTLKKLLSWRGFWGSHIKAATSLNIMDGRDFGPLWEHLVQTANEAGNGEVMDGAEAYKAVDTLLKPVKAQGNITDKAKFFPTINESLNRQERIVMALNLGNASNEQRLLGGKNWTRDQIQPVLDTLTASDWKFVQGMWDLFESYRPRVAEMEREINGVEPEWIEAKPLQVKTSDGQMLNLRGGYAPVIFDPRASGKAASFAAEKDAKAMMQAARVASTVNKSFTKARVTEVKGRPLLLSLDAMIGGIQDTIHYLHWQPWIIDANRLVKALDEPMREHYGAETVNQLRNWVGDNAAGTRGARDGAERAITNMARNVSFAGLAFNVFSAAQQVTGYSQSVSIVGAKWMGKGVAKTLQNPRKAFTEAAEKSSFMRKRGSTRMRDLAETHTVVRDQGKIRTALDETGYAMILAMQSAVDTPTWWAGYEKALDAGVTEEEAIQRADQGVIDSQGSGMSKDLASVERATGAIRLMTGFMSFMNTTLNINYRIAKSDRSVGEKAVDFVLVNAIPVILSMIIKSALTPSGDDKEKDAKQYAKEYASEQFSFMMGQMIGFREIGQAGAGMLGLPTFGYQGSTGTRIYADTLTLAKQVGQGEFDESLRKAVVNTAADFLRLPSAQINRTITGTEALLSDETDNPAAIAFGYRK